VLLLVGLGNPGARHARQRHNIGFMALDAVARSHGFAPWRSRFSSLVSDGQLGEAKVLLQKPQTYMNLSGQAVAAAARFYKVPLSEVVVCHDELDLAAGKVRIKTGGGVAGHNGLRSIAESFGSREFRRVRIGIGHPGHKDLVHGYVLSDFSKAEREDWVPRAIDAIVSEAPLLASGAKIDDEKFMSRVAFLINPPPPKPAKGDPPPPP
jgi:PTH1 family peptidyl-tRNA hydrolase